MWNVPLLRMLPNERLDLTQQQLGRANLVLLGISSVLGEDQRCGLGLKAVVRQPVDANREKSSAETKSNCCRSQRDRRQPAEKRHWITSAGDIAIDRRDHHLLVSQRLKDLAQATMIERQHADAEAGSRVAIPLEKRARLQFLGKQADRGERGRPDR